MRTDLFNRFRQLEHCETHRSPLMMSSSSNLEGGLALSYKPPPIDSETSGKSDALSRGPAPVESKPRSESPLELGSLYKVANLLKDRWIDKSETDPQLNGSNDNDLYHAGGDENATTGKNAFISGHFSAMSRRLSEQPMNGLPTEHDLFPREGSHMLRGILQRNENEEAGTPASGECVDTADSGVFAQMLQNDRERPGLARNGGYEVDTADSDSLYSGTPNEMSSVEETSDQEPALADATSYSSKVMGWNDDTAKHDDGQTGDSTGDSAEAKRARVENIISSMRPGSPPCKMTDGNHPPSPGRRPKRKQYTPQQHDANGDEPCSKQRRQEKSLLQQQLRFMQEQLTKMQTKYAELFDDETVDLFADKPFDGSGPEKDDSKFDDQNKIGVLSAAIEQMTDATDFVRRASRLEETSTKPQTLAIRAGTPSDLRGFAKILKAEITRSVGTLVDSIVAKFVEEQKKSDSRFKDMPRLPCFDKNAVLNNNNNNNYVASHLAKSAVMSRDGPRHSTPKPTRTKVTDKMLNPFFDDHAKSFADLAKMHPHFFAPPPFYSNQMAAAAAAAAAAAMQPVYGKEPEQTEALSLVVSTPKKKRTKVTDTRLSPRAARALLQDPSAPSSRADLGRPFPQSATPPHERYPVPSLLPMSLPTSVAIPNPSLQHSDVLAMYSHGGDQRTFGDSLHQMTSHSPSTADHGSPNMAHTPDMSLHAPLFKTCDMYDHSPLEGGHNCDNIGLISFQCIIVYHHHHRRRHLVVHINYSPFCS